MKKTKSILALMLISFLTSCSARIDPFSKTYGYSLIMPKGVATFPLYMEILLEDNIKTTSINNLIKNSFSTNKYDFIIYDSLEASAILKEQVNENNKLYNFKLMLTGGNYHLIGFNKTIDDIPSNSDYIYGLSKNNISTTLFSYLYGNNLIDKNYSTIDLLKEELSNLDENFTVNGKKISWCIITSPELNELKSIWNNKNIDLTNILDISLEEKFSEVNEDYSYNYIPQLALYVNNEFENKNSELVNNIVDRINIEINNVINYPEYVFKTISSKYESYYDQEEIFGYSGEILKKDNDLGIIPTNLNTEINESVINQFISIIENKEKN